MKLSQNLIKATAVIILDLINTLLTSIFFFWHIKPLNMITLNERTNKIKNWIVAKSDYLRLNKQKLYWRPPVSTNPGG
jgi:hypothetical protein